MNLRTRTILRLLGNGAFVAGLGFWGTTLAQIRPETVSSGLENPWGVAFLPSGRFLVTERPGRPPTGPNR